MLNPAIVGEIGNGDARNAMRNLKIRKNLWLELRGQIDDFCFYAYVTDNQAVYPEYVRKWVDSNDVVPVQDTIKHLEMVPPI
ncbi:MAG: hypothetical protein R2728_11215 [Chitinophagales bacterium]